MTTPSVDLTASTMLQEDPVYLSTRFETTYVSKPGFAVNVIYRSDLTRFTTGAGILIWVLFLVFLNVTAWTSDWTGFIGLDYPRVSALLDVTVKFGTAFAAVSLLFAKKVWETAQHSTEMALIDDGEMLPAGLATYLWANQTHQSAWESLSKAQEKNVRREAAVKLRRETAATLIAGKPARQVARRRAARA